MKRLILILLLIAAASSTRAEIIDRIKAVVGNRIITLSDLNREKRIREVLGAHPAKNDDELLHEMIDSVIVETEAIQFPGIEVSEADVDRQVKPALQPSGIPEAVLREAILKRLRAEQFFALRFRQFVTVTDDELRKYYEQVFVPEARRRGLAEIPNLDRVKDMIRNNVIDEKTMHEIETWLEATRRRSAIEILN